MPLTNFLEFKSRSLIQNSLVYNRQKVIVSTKCLDTRPGSVFKNLDTQQSKILTNFLEIACLTPLRTSDICLEISSDYKYCLGLKLEATVELGHRVKSQCFRHKKYLSSDTRRQLSVNIHRNHQRNLTRVFSVYSETPSDSK